jgi:hypothetical protein
MTNLQSFHDYLKTHGYHALGQCSVTDEYWVSPSDIRIAHIMMPSSHPPSIHYVPSTRLDVFALLIRCVRWMSHGIQATTENEDVSAVTIALKRMQVIFPGFSILGEIGGES